MEKPKTIENYSTNNYYNYKKDEEKTKKIKSVLGYEEDFNQSRKNQNNIKVNYNQTVYFDQPNGFFDKKENEKQIQKLISNVFSNPSKPPVLDKIETGSSIKFNFNINNNFYNANYNIQESTQDKNIPYVNNFSQNPRITYCDNNSHNKFKCKIFFGKKLNNKIIISH